MVRKSVLVLNENMLKTYQKQEKISSAKVLKNKRLPYRLGGQHFSDKFLENFSIVS